MKFAFSQILSHTYIRNNSIKLYRQINDQVYHIRISAPPFEYFCKNMKEKIIINRNAGSIKAKLKDIEVTRPQDLKLFYNNNKPNTAIS